MTLVYNFDFAHQDDAPEDGSSATWFGHAGYFKVDLSDDWSVAGRGEYFNDDDGVRIVPGSEASYQSYTGTLEYRPWEGVITRAEYRHDRSSEELFQDSDSELTDTQDTNSGEVILYY